MAAPAAHAAMPPVSTNRPAGFRRSAGARPQRRSRTCLQNALACRCKSAPGRHLPYIISTRALEFAEIPSSTNARPGSRWRSAPSRFSCVRNTPPAPGLHQQRLVVRSRSNSRTMAWTTGQRARPCPNRRNTRFLGRSAKSGSRLFISTAAPLPVPAFCSAASCRAARRQNFPFVTHLGVPSLFRLYDKLLTPDASSPLSTFLPGVASPAMTRENAHFLPMRMLLFFHHPARTCLPRGSYTSPAGPAARFRTRFSARPAP